MMSAMNQVHFLLVDDLEENLLSLTALLRRDGLVLLQARSGDEALELLLRYDVALALVDVQMPGLNGFELAELMRGNERTSRVPIIFVTAGNADSQRRFRGYEAGAVDFIQKPIEPDILRSKAEVFFELYRQRQQISVQRDELKANAEALQEADRHKDEFLATLGHELRNPLAPLRHGLDLLRRRASAAGDAAGDADVLQMMDRQMVQLVRLIDDLLDVSRVSQGKIELKRDRIQVVDVVRQAMETSRPLMEAAQHSCVLDIPPDPIWLDADLTRVSQIVGNLLNNAAKYTPEGGAIRVSVWEDGDMAVIEVADNGIGIASEMLPQVFELFAQVDNHQDRTRGGLGIGLALVRQLVTMHGGTINAASAGLGQGATFTARLPLAPAPAAVVETQPIAAAATAGHLKVLVVDDSPEIGQTLGWMLEEIGHEYVLAADGPAALQAARHAMPDAILLDIGLKGMDGYAVCQAFRRELQFRTVPIIAHSGWGQSRDKSSAAEAGFDDYLVKPVSLDDLEKTLQRVAGVQVP
jgi:signal transduction histidine kinase